MVVDENEHCIFVQVGQVLRTWEAFPLTNNNNNIHLAPFSETSSSHHSPWPWEVVWGWGVGDDS